MGYHFTINHPYQQGILNFGFKQISIFECSLLTIMASPAAWINLLIVLLEKIVTLDFISIMILEVVLLLIFLSNPFNFLFSLTQ